MADATAARERRDARPRDPLRVALPRRRIDAGRGGARAALSRAKVLRLLVAARDEGLVRIAIDAPAATRAALEARLVERFDLRAALVVEAGSDRVDVAQRVGQAAGRLWLREQLRDGTRWASAGARRSARCWTRGLRGPSRISVVSLLGGMTHSRAINPAAVARRLADALAAECYQLTAPLVVAARRRACAVGRARAARAAPPRPGAGPRAGERRRRQRRGNPVPRRAGAPGRAAGPRRGGRGRRGAVPVPRCRPGRVVDHPLNRRVSRSASTTCAARAALRAVGRSRKARACGPRSQRFPSGSWSRTRRPRAPAGGLSAAAGPRGRRRGAAW